MLYLGLGHRSHLVEEALIHVNWDELKEVLVKEGEDLGNKECISTKNIKGATSSHMLSWISAWIPALPATSIRPACLS